MSVNQGLKDVHVFSKSKFEAFYTRILRHSERETNRQFGLHEVDEVLRQFVERFADRAVHRFRVQKQALYEVIQ